MTASSCYAVYMKHVKQWWLVISLFSILVISVGSLYAAGYRIGPNISLVKTYTLTITDIPKGSSVFADYAPRGKSTENSMVINLMPGNHTILVSSKNYSPWAGLVTVPNDSNATVKALMIPKSISGTLLTGKQAKAARAVISKSKLPTKEEPLRLADGCALVYVSSSNEIVASPVTTQSCTPPPFLCIDNSCANTVIFPKTKKLTSLLVFPNRKDALLAIIGQNIFAMSLDPRSPRTFVSVLHGIAPKMNARRDGTVVVSDQSSVYTLSL